MITYQDIKNNENIRIYIEKADRSLKALGFTEHSFAHVTKCAEVSGYILQKLGYSERTVELAKIAGFMHDIGNLVNRVEHSQSGAVMAFRILDKLGMDAGEIAEIVTAIGNHDEGTGVPVSPLAAALILADKSDVRRSRVRCDELEFDIHDRVNYSVESSELKVSDDLKTIGLSIEVNSDISPVMSYFEIFLERMLMCNKAAEALGLKFSLSINGQQMI